jgi:hypothetical protein
VTAILAKPEVSLPGKFVLAKTQTLTAGEVLQTWSAATGKQAEFVKVSLEDFDRVWPMWGMEMGIMLKFWDEAKEQSWSGEEGILEAKDLGVRTEELVGLKEAFQGLDWAAVL